MMMMMMMMMMGGGGFAKIFRAAPDFVKVGQKDRALHMKM